MASVAWCLERLDEACARIQREAESKADRIIEEMSTFREYSWREQKDYFRLFGHWGPEVSPYSNWEVRRIWIPRILADLEAL